MWSARTLWLMFSGRYSSMTPQNAMSASPGANWELAKRGRQFFYYYIVPYKTFIWDNCNAIFGTTILAVLPLLCSPFQEKVDVNPHCISLALL